MDVFEYGNYKKYLSDRLPVRGPERGGRARLAAVLGCQGAFLSQVLNGHTHLSLEHAIRVDEHLGHTVEESQFFMLLVHHGRAGSRKLEDYYGRQLEEARKRRLVISERIKVRKGITKEDQAIYYGAWYYSAIHVLLMVPAFRTKQALSERLGLPPALVGEVVEFLCHAGLVRESRGVLVPEARRIHLGTDSPLLPRHHANWRIRAVNALDQRSGGALHYSGPLSLSRRNAEKVRDLLISTIEKMEPIIAEPDEQSGYCVCLDFFEL